LGARILPTGVIDGTFTVTTLYANHPSIACDGSSCLIGSSDYDNVYASRFDGGALTDATPRTIVAAASGETLFAPSVAWNGTNWVLAYGVYLTSASTARVALVDTTASLVGSAIALPAATTSTGVACAGSTCDVVLANGSMVRVDASGAVLDAAPVD